MPENDASNKTQIGELSTSSDRVSNRRENLTRHMRLASMAGFGIFPLTQKRTPAVKPQDKGGKGWQNYLPDVLADPENYPYGFGLALSETDFVLDYDPRRDADWLAANDAPTELEKLWDALKLPSPISTYIVRTGRGGVHVYFKCPRTPVGSFPKDLKDKGYPSIEIKSKGRYVVGSGSPHPEGKDYFDERGSYKEITAVPAALYTFCLRDEKLPASQKWQTALESDDEMTIRRATKYLQLAPPAIEYQGGNSATFKVAATTKELGLSLGTAFDLIYDHYNPRCQPPWSDDELRQIVANAYQYSANAQGSAHPNAHFGLPQPKIEHHGNEDPARKFGVHWDFTQDGKEVRGTLNNVLNWLRMSHWKEQHTEEYPNPLFRMFRYNLFSKQIELTKAPPWRHSVDLTNWTRDDEILLKEYFSRKKMVDISVTTVYEAVVCVANENACDPVIDYLDSTKWDGKERLSTMLIDYAGAADSRYCRAVSRLLMLGAVSRAKIPGCKFDYMVILEGDQGIGKSEFVHALGGPWYIDPKVDLSTGATTRDTIDGMQGYWVLEASELEFFRKSDVNTLKRFITLKSDRARFVYERRSQTVPRRSVFVGTINPNPEGYFSDATGNRRFMPIYCPEFDIPGFLEARDQIFAEAVAAFNAGEKPYIQDNDIKDEIFTEQQARMEADPWATTIKHWLLAGGAANLEIFDSENIAYVVLNMQPARLGQQDKRRINAIMRELGYVLVRTYINKLKNQAYIWKKGII